jgi:hypothetical protein
LKCLEISVTLMPRPQQLAGRSLSLPHGIFSMRTNCRLRFRPTELCLRTVNLVHDGIHMVSLRNAIGQTVCGQIKDGIAYDGNAKEDMEGHISKNNS